MRATTLTIVLTLIAAPWATAEPLTGIAVFGGGSATVRDTVPGGIVASNGLVSVGFVNTPFGGLAGGSLNSNGAIVNGPTTFNGDITAIFTTFNGPINAGGNIMHSSFTNTQDVTARGNVVLGGGFSVTQGNILAGGNFTLPTFGQVNGNVGANGSVTVQPVATINGNVIFGTTLSNSGTITGSTTQGMVAVNPISYVPISLTPDTFSSGGMDVTAGAFSTTTLAPGSYGDVSIVGAFSTLNLSSGDYYFDSLTLNGTALNLDLTGGSLNVFVTGDIKLDGGGVNINGMPAYINSMPNPAVQDLAALVLFESLGNITNGSPFGTGFFGTLYAPNGNISASFGPTIGSLIAGGNVTTGSFSPVFYVGNQRLLNPVGPDQDGEVPEPASLVLWGLGGLAGLAIRRRLRRRAA